MELYSGKNKKVFYVFWGLALIVLLSLWFSSVIKNDYVSVSPFNMLLNSDLGDKLGRYGISIISTSDSIAGILMVYFLLQIVVMVVGFFVPRKSGKKFDVATIVLSVILILWMLLLIMSVKSYVGGSFFGNIGNRMLGGVYASFRKSIYIGILLILGTVLCKSSKAHQIADNFGSGDDFGKIKGALNAGNKHLKTAIDSSNKYVKNASSNRKIDAINSKIREAKVNIGKEVYIGNCLESPFTEQIFSEIDNKISEIDKKERELLAANHKQKCVSCGSVIPIEARFCPECGNSVDVNDIPKVVMSADDIKRTLSRLNNELDDMYEQIGDFVAKDTSGMPDSVMAYVDILQNAEYEKKAYEEQQLRANGKMRCRNCGKIIDKDSKFCAFCGEKTDAVPGCSECGAENKPDAMFCHNCGNKLR